MKPKIGHNGGPPISLPEAPKSGWFALSRNIFDHPVVGIHNRPFTDTEAWIHLLSIASYTPTETVNKGSTIVLDPGQIMAAYAYLAKRWMWTQDKCRWFLKKLENEAMITRFVAGLSDGGDTENHTNQHTNHHPTQDTNQSTNRSTKRNTNQIQVITICNYSLYQYVQEQLHQAKPQPKPQAEHQPAHQLTHQPSPQESNTKTLRQEDNTPLPPVAKAKRSQGSRLPDDWFLPKAWGEWALRNFHVTPDAVRNSAEDFRLHWQSTAGARGIKHNWETTWQRWCGSPIQGWKRRQAVNGHAPDLGLNGHEAALSAAEIDHVRSLEKARAMMLEGRDDEP